jgi:membrane-bound lytic murein transglycosylase B
MSVRVSPSTTFGSLWYPLLALNLALTGIFITSCASTSFARKADLMQALPKTALAPSDYAYQRMIDAGISKSFASQARTQFLKQELTRPEREKIISLNIFGFLARGDYSLHYSKTAVKKTRAFVQHYYKTLSLAEKRYHVSKETIASLIWVETKYGKYTGTYPLPYVYFSLLQADHPTVTQLILQELNSRKPAALQANPTYTDSSLDQKVIDRSIKKSAWALEQLKAIDGLLLKDQKHLLTTKGSFAGAFGFPQFIPTTYADYAVSYSQHEPNLFSMRDTILSVAHYLNAKGWDESKPQAMSDALFEYNRIRDYGDVVMKIATEVRIKKKS